ncbi:hypothetical protein HPT27_15680 [Permianibacter sp. IMCC34836]|uniref:hypothetical protein n=1 Tax=Permianibacter fluminis TaxID=2738515 RepID=UPI001B7D8113|nr:hypothetical protein [Permianibacter fluminis]NQD38462.1 hypothetical protein [Permianibacter fluminis]
MFRQIMSIVVALMLLTACGQPVPAEKMAYVGLWQAKNMVLVISADGSVAYKRLAGGVTTSVNGPLKAFEGDNFVVGVGPVATTFVVTAPPHPEPASAANETVWKMTVDGVELSKSSTMSR